MSDHKIRLRAAWTWRPIEAPEAVPQRIDLPVMSWPETAWLARRIVLTRHFGCPPTSEPARLEWRSMLGVLAVRLNGRTLEPGPQGSCLVALGSRNRLEVEVDLAARGEASEEWGEVWLRWSEEESGLESPPNSS